MFQFIKKLLSKRATTPHLLKEELEWLLKKKGLTVHDLSRFLEISYWHLCLVLNGWVKPSPKLESDLHIHHMQLVKAVYDKDLTLLFTRDEKGVLHYIDTEETTGYDFKVWEDESGETLMRIIPPKRGKQWVH